MGSNSFSMLILLLLVECVWVMVDVVDQSHPRKTPGGDSQKHMPLLSLTYIPPATLPLLPIMCLLLNPMLCSLIQILAPCCWLHCLFSACALQRFSASSVGPTYTLHTLPCLLGSDSVLLPRALCKHILVSGGACTPLPLPDWALLCDALCLLLLIFTCAVILMAAFTPVLFSLLCLNVLEQWKKGASLLHNTGLLRRRCAYAAARHCFRKTFLACAFLLALCLTPVFYPFQAFACHAFLHAEYASMISVSLFCFSGILRYSLAALPAEGRLCARLASIPFCIFLCLFIARCYCFILVDHSCCLFLSFVHIC